MAEDKKKEEITGIDITEEYLKEALDAYRDKYGVRTDIDNYTVYFIPSLTVFKKV